MTRSASFALLLFAFSPFALFPLFSSAATVSAVLDGDTIVLTDGTRVRYLGINTPERGQPFYEEAKRYNERLVFGKEVRLETGKQERDGYGRVLAYVYAGNVMVNARVIAEGWAHVFVTEPFDRQTEWLQLQKDARAQQKGMWRSGGVPGPLKITTVKADAPGDDRRNPNGEYIRVCNVHDKPVELQGFTIRDAGRHRYVFPGGTLQPGYTVFLHSGRGRERASRGALTFYWGAGPVWNNDKDMASLFHPDGRLIDAFQVRGRERSS
ncbi:MAG: thermonuclease family protein [Candidatus Binatia bacterium]